MIAPPGSPTIGTLTWSSLPALGKNKNEDLVGATANAVWLLDGASTPQGVPSCCDRDAQWYVPRLDTALITGLLATPNATLRELLANAITIVAQEHARHCTHPDLGLGPSATVAIARQRVDRIDLLLLGDSTIVLELDDRVTALQDKRLAAIAPDTRAAIHAELAAGHGYASDEHRHHLAHVVEQERRARNRDGGYWIASDAAHAARHALVAEKPAGDLRAIVLMSDGAEQAVDRLDLYASLEDAVRDINASGIDRFLRGIRAAEQADPNGRQHPRTKPSDDATIAVWRR